MPVGRTLLVLVAAVLMTAIGCAAPAVGQAADGETITEITAPYRFSIASWEMRMLPAEIAGWSDDEAPLDADDIDLVVMYFTMGAELRLLEAELDRAAYNGTPTADLESRYDVVAVAHASLAGDARDILARQITEVLETEGIVHPFEHIEPESVFPPVSFVMAPPPTLLVISPRDYVYQEKTVTLLPDLGTEERVAIESRVDALGWVSLVVDLGGIGATYPALVNDSYRLQTTIEIAVEEWLHQYLVFEPLGGAYLRHLLGIREDGDIVTINETLVGIVSDELALKVMTRYYPQYIIVEAEPAPEGEFDYNRAMRETRLTVDALLADGDIAGAEVYMEERRQYLAENGYYIRKLNQAYFAFHGSYGDEATSVDPVGEDLRALRERYDSLREFLAAAAEMKSRGDIAAALAQ